MKWAGVFDVLLGTLSRFQRVLIVIFVAWSLVASGAYYSAIESIQPPAWISLWAKVYPFESGLPIFDVGCMNFVDGSFACSLSTSAIGFVAFILYPMILATLLLLGVKWTLFGKVKS